MLKRIIDRFLEVTSWQVTSMKADLSLPHKIIDAKVVKRPSPPE